MELQQLESPLRLWWISGPSPTTVYTLTVTGILAGTYQCSVENDQGQATSQLLDVKGANPPSGLEADQYGSTITVYWTPPTVGATPTGYVIYYQAKGEAVESVTINDATLVQHSIVGVQSNKVYSITMLILSSMLPSQETIPFIVERVDVYASIVSVTGIHVKWRSVAMPADTSIYCFIVYYTIANEGGKAIGESTFRVPGNITYFIIEVSELAPGLHHQFQVSITLLRGERKIERERSVVTTQSTVIFDQAYFQLQIGPLDHPGTWSFTRGIKMEQIIREEVATVIRRRCGCSFPPENLRIGKLSCRSTFQQRDLVWVTYRSIVVTPPSLSVTSLELVEHIQAWVASNTTISAGPFTLNVNPSCRVGVASLEEPECHSFS